MKKLFLAIIISISSLSIINAQILVKSEVRQSMRRVADWQIAHFNEVPHGDLNWVNATFYLGLCHWAEIAKKENQDEFYYNWLMRMGDRNNWQVDKRMYHADDICVGQTYLQLYRKYKQQEIIAPTRARAEWVIKNPPKGSFLLNYSDPSTLNHWTWCDALFMAPPVYLGLYELTGDKKFIRFMDKEYKKTYDYLFDKKENLFYRDHRFFKMKEANGEKVFWGRGNGWVLGGLVEMLRELPEKSKYRGFYKELFVNLCRRIAPLQNKDGFWHASLLDPNSYPSPETSASGFFVYALAYGVNEGLLPEKEFSPVIKKGWKALLSVVEEDGKLGYVQPIGADPKKVDRDMTEVYGPGAFLLTGSEIYRMAQETPLSTKNISASRVQEIASMLSENPQGIGINYKNRTFWDKMKTSKEAQKLLSEEAPALLKKGMPPFIDSLYLDLNKSNVRLPGENMMNARFHYLFRLALAECLENQKRYIPAIEKALIELCNQKPWSIPAHDRSLQNYNGTNYYVDLVVATAGNSMAQCMTLLDDRISPEVKARVQCAFREKVFRPIYRCLEETKPFYWFTVTNNWNSVCLAGVTGAALTLLQDKEERAYFIAAAEKYNGYGMKGYGEDGYCSEGVGYYNYGFRAYILLREEVCRATKGEIDFFNNPKFVRIAQYGKNIQMINGICPAYSDCRMGLSPDLFITNYCDRALGISADNEECRLPGASNMSLYLIECFPHQAWEMAQTDEIKKELGKNCYDPLRSYYNKAEVLMSRPSISSSCPMAISVKGGNNAENHNHNDIGSYVVILNKETMAGDQGGPFSYPGDYFSAEASEKYKIKSSFGHPVPVVDGRVQITGKKAQASIIQKEFTAQQDIYSIDYTCAYSTPKLDKLIRTFVYDRTKNGTFTVGDEFIANSPIRFETAVTTQASWKILDNSHLLLSSGKEQMEVKIESSGKVEFTSEQIEVNSPLYTRIGIRLKEKTSTGYIKLVMYPKHP